MRAVLRFQWPWAGSEPQMPRLPYGITPPIQANPSLHYIWDEAQTSTYYCHNCNFPGGEAGTNLYCLVNRGTYVWTTCPRSLPGSALAWSRTCNLWVTSSARYHYTTKPHKSTTGLLRNRSCNKGLKNGKKSILTFLMLFIVFNYTCRCCTWWQLSGCKAAVSYCPSWCWVLSK